jgi:hypothetical protein
MAAWDCSAPVEILGMLATDALGREPAEFEAAVAKLTAAGEASLDAETGLLFARSPLCEPTPDLALDTASSWVESWLSEAEGCRRSLSERAGLAEGQGLAPDAFAEATSLLVASGMLRQEGAEVVHLLACRPPDLPADLVERVRQADLAGLRGLLALHLMGEGDCRVSGANRAAVVEAVALQALPQFGLVDPAPPDAVAAIKARVEEVLDNPGPAYQIESGTGDLVMVHCAP